MPSMSISGYYNGGTEGEVGEGEKAKDRVEITVNSMYEML